MKIIKHCSQAFPTTATGCLVGMDVNGILEITNTFPFPTLEGASAAAAATDSQYPSNDSTSAKDTAAAAPRAKANGVYQNEMIKLLREVNVDANCVGWYCGTSMGAFVNLQMVENQFFFQKEMGEVHVALVHDVSRSSQGALSLRAFRLSPVFMTAYREGKFTVDS